MDPDLIERLNAALSGRYQIESELGAGGMATVYLADDLKHERKVAVKVLRPELAAVIGGERFLAEIKTTAALQHPHILPLFDSGEADGFLYYVMPYVDGESLRAHLDRETQLDVDEALRIAKAVASALGYAHDHDVIHRDIKPENILLHAGQPVVADFGIALAISAAGGGRMTETGLSLGTPHYMSPEQASADRDLSARSDVYSVGCVLYEMLAGQPPHTGPTAQSILVRILTEDPRPLTDLRRTVPAHVAAVVTKSIEKLPADRFKTSQEFAAALDDESFRWEPARSDKTSSTSAPHPSAAAQSTSAGWDTRSRVLATTTMLFAALAGVFALDRGGNTGLATDAPVLSFVMQDSADQVFMPAVGVDGTTLMVLNGVIHVRPAGALSASPLEETSDVTFARFSPDADWIAFVTDGQTPSVRKVPTRGGPVVTLWSEAEDNIVLQIPAWGDDGWIYGTATDGSAGTSRVFRVSEVGGPAETLFDYDEQAWFPEPVPGGEGILLTLFSNTGQDGRIVSLDLESRDTATVIAEGFTARWLPTGHVVYAHPSGALFAVPFDARSMAATGPPVPVLDGVGTFAEAIGRYDVSRSGTIVYIRAPAVGGGGDFSFALVNLDGGAEVLPLEATDHWDAGFSPDGRRVAYIRDGSVWVYDLDLGNNRQLTSGNVNAHNPRWSPDGTEIAYVAIQDSTAGIWIQGADGGGDPRLAGEGVGLNPAQWLEDGTILYSADDGDIGKVSADGEGGVTPLFQADWDERGPVVSPDRQWIAYVADEGGQYALFVRSWPDLGNKMQVSDGTAPLVDFSFPVWTPDGSSLVYHQGNQLMQATVDTSDGFRVESRRSISVASPAFYLADMHPDGRPLLMTVGEVAEGEQAMQAQLIVTANWFTELQARLGGGSP